MAVGQAPPKRMGNASESLGCSTSKAGRGPRVPGFGGGAPYQGGGGARERPTPAFLRRPAYLGTRARVRTRTHNVGARRRAPCRTLPHVTLRHVGTAHTRRVGASPTRPTSLPSCCDQVVTLCPGTWSHTYLHCAPSSADIMARVLHPSKRHAWKPIPH